MKNKIKVGDLVIKECASKCSWCPSFANETGKVIKFEKVMGISRALVKYKNGEYNQRLSSLSLIKSEVNYANGF